MSAIAFIVNPVKPKVACISPVVFSAISTLLLESGIQGNLKAGDYT